MNTFELIIISVLCASLLSAVTPMLAFLLCFYIGFKLVCRDFEIEMELRNYIARRVREFIQTIPE